MLSKSEPVRIEDLDDFEYAVLKAQGECKVLGHSVRHYTIVEMSGGTLAIDTFMGDK